MALLKADMTIARDYAGLCLDDDTRESVYGRILSEYESTESQLRAVYGGRDLSDINPVQDLSLSRRNPYLDPLNAIQATLLARYRDDETDETEREQWRAPLLRTVNAIAAGMRNTG